MISVYVLARVNLGTRDGAVQIIGPPRPYLNPADLCELSPLAREAEVGASRSGSEAPFD